MRTYLRVILELLGPAFIAAGLFLAYDSVRTPRWPEWNLVPGLLIDSYIFAAFPSVIYTLMMEGAFRRGMHANSWANVGLSTLLGGGAGAGIGCMVSVIGKAGTVSAYAMITGVFVVIGMAVGLILGLLIMAFSPKVERRPGHRLLRWDRPFDGQI